ncbi:MAG: hypothetical protein BroJett011_76470 [Chloroflexota bacterium]|nr:MAG: hypothetical protein BroJett011_76470 [Chloroflexota bacterium]
MKLKTLEVSLSKEERRIVDEHGNTASTWARIGFTVELEQGDIPDRCIKQLKGEIQPEVDAWLLNQGGYIAPPREDGPAGDEVARRGQEYSPHADIPELGEREILDVFQDVEIELSQVEDKPAAVADDEVDEIPL